MGSSKLLPMRFPGGGTGMKLTKATIAKLPYLPARVS